MRIALVLCGLMLSACVLGGADARKLQAPAANPITGAAIATTSLDAPTAANPALAAAPTKPTPTKPAPTDEKPKAQAVAPEEAAKPAPTPQTPTQQTPAAQSPAEVKCENSGGIWSDAGKSGAQTCVRTTKDAGKSCTRQTQCEGFCLSRSKTCAPVTPLFGCNDILQADGRQVTLCID